MKLTEDSQKTQEFMQSLIIRSWEDETFKGELVKDPIAAIEQYTDKSLKVEEGKKIVVVDQSDQNIIYVNIPAQPRIDDLQLTDEQLEIVAGGGTPIYGATVAAFMLGAFVYDRVDAYLDSQQPVGSW